MKFEKILSFFGNNRDLALSNSFYGWLIIAVLFLILEMISPGLFFFTAFFFGGIAAAISSFFTEIIMIQTAVFLISTALALYILHSCIVPSVSNKPIQRTNVYALKGKQGIVIKDIRFSHPGLVKINGESWAAKVLKDEVISVGQLIEVIDMRGAHVVVKKVE